MKLLTAVLALFLGCAAPQSNPKAISEESHPCDFASLGEAVQTLYQRVQQERYRYDDATYLHGYLLPEEGVESRVAAFPEVQAFTVGYKPLPIPGMPGMYALFPSALDNPEEYSLRLKKDPEGKSRPCTETAYRKECEQFPILEKLERHCLAMEWEETRDNYRGE